MALPGEIGWIGKNCPTHQQTRLLSKAMRSGAGWFIATICERCQQEDPSPHSRETEYYETREDLVKAGLAGTIRWRDTQFRGLKLDNDLNDQLVFMSAPEPVTDKYAVICRIHDRVFLSQRQYDAQMSDPNSRWICPKCGRIAAFDDDTYEASLPPDDGPDSEQDGLPEK